MLTDKRVWVTGAGRGLGRAIALAAAAEGAVVAVSSRRAQDLEAVAHAAPDRDRILVMPLDVTERDAVSAVANTLVGELGGIDCLLNAAGISPVFVPSADLRAEDWERVLEVNLSGTFHCCQAAGHVMLEAGRGSIVNVTSVHASRGWPRLAAYAASKGGIAALTKALAVEWAPRGVRVNSLVPGYFETDLSAGILHSRHGERIRQATPLGRAGEPHELVRAATYLLSDDSDFVVGSELVVDGGWSAW